MRSLVVAFFLPFLAWAEPHCATQAYLNELEQQYKDHALTIKAVLASGVSCAPLPALLKGEREPRFGEPLKSGQEVQINVFRAGDLKTIRFFTADKKLEIVPKVTHRQLSGATTETRPVAVATISINGRTSQQVSYGTFNIPAKSEIVFTIDQEAIDQARPADDGKIETALVRLFELKPSDTVEVSAACDGRQKAKGPWSPVRQDRIYSTFEFLSGISDQCRSTPEAIAKDRSGEVAWVTSSRVLNSGVQRATLGHFVRVKSEGSSNYRGYFVLLSYLRAASGATAGGPECASEALVFGPFGFQGDGNTAETTAPPLQAGWVVSGSGELLAQLPLELARVANYRSAASDEPLKTGVRVAGEGCVKCHAQRDASVDTTAPFPWGR